MLKCRGTGKLFWEDEVFHTSIVGIFETVPWRVVVDKTFCPKTKSLRFLTSFFRVPFHQKGLRCFFSGFLHL